MGTGFLAKFLHVAKEITEAERGMAVDANLELLDTFNLTSQIIASQHFNQVAQQSFQRALERQEMVITNNIVTDPSQAPTTNTNFADLRVVVVIPVKGHGAIYLDRHIKRGVMPRDKVEKLMRLGARVVENGLEDCSETQLHEWYEQM